MKTRISGVGSQALFFIVGMGLTPLAVSADVVYTYNGTVTELVGDVDTFIGDVQLGDELLGMIKVHSDYYLLDGGSPYEAGTNTGYSLGFWMYRTNLIWQTDVTLTQHSGFTSDVFDSPPYTFPGGLQGEAAFVYFLSISGTQFSLVHYDGFNYARFAGTGDEAVLGVSRVSDEFSTIAGFAALLSMSLARLLRPARMRRYSLARQTSAA